MLTQFVSLALVLHLGRGEASHDSEAIERASGTQCLKSSVVYAINLSDTALGFAQRKALQDASIFAGSTPDNEGCTSVLDRDGSRVLTVGLGECQMERTVINMMVVYKIKVTMKLTDSWVIVKMVSCSYPRENVVGTDRVGVSLKVTLDNSPIAVRPNVPIRAGQRVNIEVKPIVSWYTRLDRLDGLPINCQFIAHRDKTVLKRSFFSNGCAVQETLSNGSRMELFGVRVSLHRYRGTKVSFVANELLYSLGNSVELQCQVFFCSSNRTNGALGFPTCPKPCSSDLSHLSNQLVSIQSDRYQLLPSQKNGESSGSDFTHPSQLTSCASCSPPNGGQAAPVSLSIKMTAIVTFASFALGVATTGLLWFLHNRTRRKAFEPPCAQEANLHLMST